MILEEIIRSLREKRERLIGQQKKATSEEQRAYITGRIREIEELLTQLENIA